MSFWKKSRKRIVAFMFSTLKTEILRLSRPLPYPKTCCITKKREKPIKISGFGFSLWLCFSWCESIWNDLIWIMCQFSIWAEIHAKKRRRCGNGQNQTKFECICTNRCYIIWIEIAWNFYGVKFMYILNSITEPAGICMSSKLEFKWVNNWIITGNVRVSLNNCIWFRKFVYAFRSV